MEFDCLQPRKRNIHTAIFDTKQNNVEAKGNIALFFGLNKISVCMTGICAKFPFKRHSYIYLYIFINKFQTQVCAIPCQTETVLRGTFQKQGK